MLWFTEPLIALRKPISDLSLPDTSRNNKKSTLAAQRVTEHRFERNTMTLLPCQRLNGFSGVTVPRKVFNAPGKKVKGVDWWSMKTTRRQKSLISSSSNCFLDRFCCNSHKLILKMISRKCPIAINVISLHRKQQHLLFNGRRHPF